MVQNRKTHDRHSGSHRCACSCIFLDRVIGYRQTANLNLEVGIHMENEVIRHMQKYAKAMYVMVSIPENKEENIYVSPRILGCFKTKADAKAAWKARTPEFKSIKAKSVHVYYFDLQTDVPEIPETVFFCGSYKVTKYSGELHFSFIPDNGYPDIESYYNVLEWVNSLHPLSCREFCAGSNGWETFYASNELFCVECPVNMLVNIAVPLKDVADERDN